MKVSRTEEGDLVVEDKILTKEEALAVYNAIRKEHFIQKTALFLRMQEKVVPTTEDIMQMTDFCMRYSHVKLEKDMLKEAYENLLAYRAPLSVRIKKHFPKDVMTYYNVNDRSNLPNDVQSIDINSRSLCFLSLKSPTEAIYMQMAFLDNSKKEIEYHVVIKHYDVYRCVEDGQITIPNEIKNLPDALEWAERNKKIILPTHKPWFLTDHKAIAHYVCVTMLKEVDS